eukprot:bmy_13723T0
MRQYSINIYEYLVDFLRIGPFMENMVRIAYSISCSFLIALCGVYQSLENRALLEENYQTISLLTLIEKLVDQNESPQSMLSLLGHALFSMDLKIEGKSDAHQHLKDTWQDENTEEMQIANILAMELNDEHGALLPTYLDLLIKVEPVQKRIRKEVWTEICMSKKEQPEVIRKFQFCLRMKGVKELPEQALVTAFLFGQYYARNCGGLNDEIVSRTGQAAYGILRRFTQTIWIRNLRKAKYDAHYANKSRVGQTANFTMDIKVYFYLYPPALSGKEMGGKGFWGEEYLKKLFSYQIQGLAGLLSVLWECCKTMLAFCPIQSQASYHQDLSLRQLAWMLRSGHKEDRVVLGLSSKKFALWLGSHLKAEVDISGEKKQLPIRGFMYRPHTLGLDALVTRDKKPKSSFSGKALKILHLTVKVNSDVKMEDTCLPFVYFSACLLLHWKDCKPFELCPLLLSLILARWDLTFSALVLLIHLVNVNQSVCLVTLGRHDIGCQASYTELVTVANVFNPPKFNAVQGKMMFENIYKSKFDLEGKQREESVEHQGSLKQATMALHNPQYIFGDFSPDEFHQFFVTPCSSIPDYIDTEVNCSSTDYQYPGSALALDGSTNVEVEVLENDGILGGLGQREHGSECSTSTEALVNGHVNPRVQNSVGAEDAKLMGDVPLSGTPRTCGSPQDATDFGSDALPSGSFPEPSSAGPGLQGQPEGCLPWG